MVTWLRYGKNSDETNWHQERIQKLNIILTNVLIKNLVIVATSHPILLIGYGIWKFLVGKVAMQKDNFFLETKSAGEETYHTPGNNSRKEKDCRTGKNCCIWKTCFADLCTFFWILFFPTLSFSVQQARMKLKICH